VLRRHARARSRRDQNAKLWQDASRENGAITQSANSGSIVSDFNSHLDKLRGIESSSEEFEKKFQDTHERWKYYADQEDYIFGKEPANNVTMVRGGVEQYVNTLNVWATIQNKQDRQIINMFLWYPQIMLDDVIRRAAAWQRDCERRLGQVKATLQ
jgi:hypothetical protein